MTSLAVHTPAAATTKERAATAWNVAANRAVVAAYRLVGFCILGGILFGLVSYLGLRGFYLVHFRWIAPVVISPADPRVQALATQAAQHHVSRARLAAERRDLEIRKASLLRQQALEESFLLRLRRAIGNDAAAAAARIDGLRSADQALVRAEEELGRAAPAYSSVSRGHLEELRLAHIIDETEAVRKTYDLSQATLATASLAERKAMLENHIADLERTAEELKWAAAAPSRAGLGYRSLKASRELMESEMALARAREEITSVTKTLFDLDQAILRRGELLHGVEEAPFLKALSRRLTVAFVPYANLAHARAGAAVYGCRLLVLLCRPVGLVREALEGEVSSQHPVFSRQLRGVMVRIELSDPLWAQESVLHLGRAPLWL